MCSGVVLKVLLEVQLEEWALEVLVPLFSAFGFFASFGVFALFADLFF